MKIEELKIIVTGAASGIGKCFTQELIKHGAQVMAADINEAGLFELRDEINSDKLAIFQGDISDEQSVINLVKETTKTFGLVNGLINNAGIFRDSLLVSIDKDTGNIRKMSLNQWQKVIDIDLTGPFLCTRETAAAMIENKVSAGVIINVSSVSRHGNRGQSNYSAAKAGLVADTKLWGEELARFGIRVGAVAPGFVKTPILDAMRPEILDRVLGAVPLKRAADPLEIFLAIKFIIECDYFTSRCVDVDGGVTV